MSRDLETNIRVKSPNSTPDNFTMLHNTAVRLLQLCAYIVSDHCCRQIRVRMTVLFSDPTAACSIIGHWHVTVVCLSGGLFGLCVCDEIYCDYKETCDSISV